MLQFTRRRFIGTALLTQAALALSPNLALASPSDDKRAEAAAIAEQLAVWQRQLEIDSDAYYQALDAHDAAVAAMEDAQGRVDTANESIALLTEHLSARAVNMYRNGSYSLLDVLLGTATFTQFVETVSFIEDMNNADQQAIKQLKVARDEAQAAADEYALAEQEALAQLTTAEQVQANASTIVGQYQAKLDSLDAEIAQLVAEEKEAAAIRVAQEYGESVEEISAETSDSLTVPSAPQTGNQNGSSDGGASSNSGSGSQSNSGGSSSNSGGGSSSSSGGSSQPAPAQPAYEPEPEPEPEPAPAPAYNGAAETIVAAAYSQLGVPYVWGGSTPYRGLDCSGLVQYCYACAGVYLPRYSQSQRNSGTRVSLSNARRGDILGNSYHVGIYLGDGAYIHAPDVGQVVCVSYNMGLFDDATRIL